MSNKIFGIPVSQEPKYGINNQGRLFNRETGNVIPDDEPVFILRGRDIHAVRVLTDYWNMCNVPGHRDVVRQRIADFQQFRHENQDRMREPGFLRQSEKPKEKSTWQYVISMPDGSKWSVPVEIIARNRAIEYADEFGGDIERSLAEDTIPLFKGDPYEIEDWAANNMNWIEVSNYAVMVSGPDAANFQDGWINGEKEVISE